MVYEVPKSQASIAQNRFEFAFPPAKKKYSIPLLKYLKPVVAMRVEDLNWREAIKVILDDCYPDDDLMAKFDEGEQFGAWLEAYHKASDFSLGESEASSDS